MPLLNSPETFLRIVLGVFFLLAGVGHVVNWDATLEGAKLVSDGWLASLFPDLAGEISEKVLATASVFCLIVGGAIFIWGRYLRWGACILILFLIPATMLHATIMEIAANHAAGLVAQSSEKAKQTLQVIVNIAVQGHQANFMKNMILIANCLFFLLRGDRR